MSLSARRRRYVMGGAAFALALCVGGALAPGASASAPAPTDASATKMFSVGGLIVAGMSIAPDGRVFYVGPGHSQIYVWSPVTKKVTTFASIKNATDVYGVTLSPQFSTNHYVYAYANVTGTAPGGLHEILVRFTGSKGKGTAYKQLRNIGATGTEHVGGKIVIDPTGKLLYLIVGDGGDPANSQNPLLDHGKILRLTTSGAAAPGNPGFGDKAIYATGIRNSIGMTLDPQTGNLWETENGPECNDELNLITSGANYGWGPSEVCDGTVNGTNQDGVDPTLPAENIPTVIAPVGATFCNGCGLPEAEGNLVYGSYLDESLHNVTLDPTRTTVVSDVPLYQDTSDILAVESSPVDGSIWFADGNHIIQRLEETPAQ